MASWFKMHHYFRGMLEQLTAEEVGMVTLAALRYSETGELPEASAFSVGCRVAFQPIKASIDTANADYMARCERNRENGRLGGRPKKEKTQSVISETEKTQMVFEKPKQTEVRSKKLEVRSEKNNTYTSCMCSRFDEFWSAYPKKQAKQDAAKAWKKVSPDDALADRILAALDVRKRSQDWQKENGKYIPLPATWLNGRRWEDEVSLPVKRVKQAAQERDYELEALYEPGGKYAS